ncbi:MULTISPECIES: GNAT family N-acetyltransferase [Bacillus]|uniref:GNAT family N-acetyltransferase n=1 Tax=Bacillus TaxID=1386 RepID=UPI000BB94488|nr:MULTISPECIES: GNAT family N-acetyltransferase [Bacillus]
MQITLEKANCSDAEIIHDIQIKAFLPLLEKYKDYHTNPANETIDKVLTRINDPSGSFYKIYGKDAIIGAIRVYPEIPSNWWISPMFILPCYQGKGIAQKVLKIIEEKTPEAKTWNLATILQEERNCYLYEKMGYMKTGEYKEINELTTLVYYKKK